MKKLLIILIILLVAGFAYAKFSVTDLVVVNILKPYTILSPIGEGDALLLETGDYLLLESGDKLLLE